MSLVGRELPQLHGAPLVSLNTLTIHVETSEIVLRFSMPLIDCQLPVSGRLFVILGNASARTKPVCETALSTGMPLVGSCLQERESTTFILRDTSAKTVVETKVELRVFEALIGGLLEECIRTFLVLSDAITAFVGHAEQEL